MERNELRGTSLVADPEFRCRSIRATCSRRMQVAGLVDAEARPTGQRDMGGEAPALVRDRLSFYLLLAEAADQGLYIVAHEVEFGGRCCLQFCRMEADFRGREARNQPATAGINRRKAEDIANKSTIRFGISAEDHNVRTG